MPVFFITSQQVRNGTVTITGPLLDHLRASLRTQVGERLWLCDERQRRYCVLVSQLSNRLLTGTVLEERSAAPLQNPSIILAQAILKGDRMDWVIQKATELGVRTIIPLQTRHGVVRPRAARVDAQHARWQRIAWEAAQQSEQWAAPSIQLPIDVEAFFAQPGNVTAKLILCERAAGQSLSSVPLPHGPESSIAVVIGPEGGWTSEELALAEQAGFTGVTLGARILRAETAAVASVSVLQSRLGELG